MRLLLFHENPEVMPQLAAAIARHAGIAAIRVVGPAWYLRARRGRGAGFAWNEHASANWQRLAVVPGLRRFARPSASLLRRQYRRAVARTQPDAVLVDSPYLEPMLDVVSAPVGYVAADAYAYYDWDHEETARLEARLLNRSDAVFAVAHRLIEDFEAQGARNVVHLGTAVPEAFVDACHRLTSIPAKLAAIPGPRVGSVGMINRTYDWALIEALTIARPGVSFVFIGPIVEPHRDAARRIDEVLARPNVHWLGPVRHDELPRYLGAFDALLNPLEVNEHSDRRSPLRICEYMATDRPVLSTAIHELQWFPPDIVSIDTAEGAPGRLDGALNGTAVVGLDARAAWLAENTWDARARTVIDTLEGVLSAGPVTAG